MTPRQRTRHFRTWLVLAVALPLGFILAFAQLPLTIGNIPVTSEEDEEEFLLQLIGNERIVISVNAPIQSPSLLVYLSQFKDDRIGNCGLLGRLDEVGNYTFELDSLSSLFPEYHVYLFDPIKEKLHHYTQLK